MGSHEAWRGSGPSVDYVCDWTVHGDCSVMFESLSRYTPLMICRP